jgi:enterochelin esterase family protein
VDVAPGGVVVDPTTGNGKFEFNGPMAVPADAVLKAGVTAGMVQDIMVTGKVFPGPRPVHIYRPNGYVANTPVAFMVFFDNTDYIERFKIPTILDNYIAAKKLPMMVAIFISESGNRSVEYDSLTDANTRFVMDDIFPEVEKLGIKLSTDPDASCVGGHSSGGIAAFTMGWHRPDRFHRIISNSGSFTISAAGMPTR